MGSHVGTSPPFGPAHPLVGREREQRLLREALASALGGRGGLVLIAGEAGIGKTALARDLAREARAQAATVLLGRAYDLREPSPHEIWLDLLRSAPPDDQPDPLGEPRAALQPAAGQGGGGQAAIFARAFAGFVRLASQRPLVGILDDLHWADHASLDLLRFVARQLDTHPFLLVGTYRADEIAEQHPLFRLLPALVREAEPLRLTLAPLAAEAVRELIRADYTLAAEDEARLVAYLRERTSGNPLYLGEVLRTLEEERTLRPGGGGDWALADLAGLRVPPLLRQVIAERLDRLGDDANRWLAVASVIGQEVPLDLWSAIGEVSQEALLALVERATAARVLDALPDGQRVQFHHPLIRQALYDGLSPPRRRVIHQQIGDLLAAAAQPDLDVVADHLRRAGDRRAWAWLMRAGLRARHAAAWVSAAERCAEAAAVLAQDGGRERERGWLLFYCGRLRFFSDTAQALRDLDEAESLALTAGEEALTAFIRISRSVTRCLRTDIRRGLAEMERAVEALERVPGRYHLLSGDQAATIVLEALLSERSGTSLPLPPNLPAVTNHRINLFHWFAQAGRYREALAMGLPLTAILRTSGGADDTANLGSAHLGLGNAYAALGRPVDARREHSCALAAHRAVRDTFMAGYTVWIDLLLVHLPYQADDLAARSRAAAEGATIWSQAAGITTTATHGAQSGLPLAMIEGRWTEARRLAQDGLGSAIVGYFLGARVALGLLDRWQGQPARAWDHVRASQPDGPETEPGNTYFPHGIAALALAADLALDAGALDQAVRWIAAHDRWLEWSGALLWQSDQHRLRARHAQLSGGLAQARQYAEAALARACDPRQPLAVLAAHRLLGELAAAEGRYADAQSHLEAALALADACAAPYERALTLLALAELHWAAGRVPEAPVALDHARATFERLGAAPALARADRLAAKLALVRAQPAYPDGLTEREVDVLRLVAAGRSNREVARVLSVSERTVERHLENSYRKVGARNRAEVTAYALRNNLT